MTEEFSPDIKAAIEIGGLFASRWERREMEPVLKEEVAAIIRKHSGWRPQWRPIESAPKDRQILVSGGEYGAEETGHEFQAKFNGVALAEWYETDFRCVGDYNTYYLPTHWMPLPAAPIAAAPSGEKK